MSFKKKTYTAERKKTEQKNKQQMKRAGVNSSHSLIQLRRYEESLAMPVQSGCWYGGVRSEQPPH